MCILKKSNNKFYENFTTKKRDENAINLVFNMCKYILGARANNLCLLTSDGWNIFILNLEFLQNLFNFLFYNMTNIALFFAKIEIWRNFGDNIFARSQLYLWPLPTGKLLYYTPPPTPSLRFAPAENLSGGFAKCLQPLSLALSKKLF